MIQRSPCCDWQAMVPTTNKPAPVPSVQTHILSSIPNTYTQEREIHSYVTWVLCPKKVAVQLSSLCRDNTRSMALYMWSELASTHKESDPSFHSMKIHVPLMHFKILPYEKVLDLVSRGWEQAALIWTHSKGQKHSTLILALWNLWNRVHIQWDGETKQRMECGLTTHNFCCRLNVCVPPKPICWDPNS